MKSGAIESSRRKEWKIQRSEQRQSRETERSEVCHRSCRTDVSGDTRRVESRRSTVVRCETSVPATRQKMERTEKEDKEKEKSGEQDPPPRKVPAKKRQVVERERAEPVVAIPLAPAKKWR